MMVFHGLGRVWKFACAAFASLGALLLNWNQAASLIWFRFGLVQPDRVLRYRTFMGVEEAFAPVIRLSLIRGKQASDTVGGRAALHRRTR